MVKNIYDNFRQIAGRGNGIFPAALSDTGQLVRLKGEPPGRMRLAEFNRPTEKRDVPVPVSGIARLEEMMVRLNSVIDRHVLPRIDHFQFIAAGQADSGVGYLLRTAVHIPETEFGRTGNPVDIAGKGMRTVFDMPGIFPIPRPRFYNSATHG